MGPLANKVWVQPESLASSAPRPCGHEDLNRILRPQVVGISDAAEEGAVCASNRRQGAAVARACTVKRGATRTWRQNSWRGCRAALEQVAAWSWSLRLRISGDPEVCTRFEDVERSKTVHQCRARRQSRSWRQKAWRRSRQWPARSKIICLFIENPTEILLKMKLFRPKPATP